MNNLRYSIRELKNSWFFKIIMLIQITITVVLLYRVIELKNFESAKLTLMDEIVDNKIIYSIAHMYDSPEELFSVIDDEKISKLSNAIEDKYNIVTVKYGEVSMRSFQGREKFIDKDLDHYKGENEFEPINSLECSASFFDTFGVKLSQGDINEFIEFTKLTSLERKEKALPAFLGDSYKGIFKLGDIIETEFSTIKVAGFLEKNQFYLDKGIYEPTRCKSLNTFILVPISKDLKEANITNALLISADSDFSLIQKDIEEISKELGLKFSISNPKDNIDSFVDIITYEANLRILIVYIVILFVAIGLIAIFSNRINVRRKEFSVHIMHGATYKDIYIRVFLEHLYILIFSIIIAFYYIKKIKYNIMFQSINFDFKAFGQATLIIFVVVFIVAMIPIYRISRNRLDYLIKGE